MRYDLLMNNSEKKAIRDAVRLARGEQRDKEVVSRMATARLLSMPEYQNARCVLWYVDVRDELRTQQAIAEELKRGSGEGRTIAVPYCRGDELEIFRLHGMEDLAVGKFGILEPRVELRGDSGRLIEPQEIELVVVPGVAFDPQGGRLGHGRGFYDRLLAQVGRETVLVGLAFECQLVCEIPLAEHDVSMDWVVTPHQTIRCLGDTRVHVDREDC